MYIEQLYTGCLALASYYVESLGEAAIIDPVRDIDTYIQLAEKRGAKIKYVFETHFHADFVSGHIDLALKTGATIVFGPGAIAEYKIYTATDGEEFKLGDITLKVIHTPGHTLESICLLLLDENKNPHSVFSGDTLFVGDVGSPVLAPDNELSIMQMAELLYDSIENKLKSLPNYVILYPGHGAGSPCGKSIGVELHSTIGIAKQTNYALKAKDRQDFIKQVTEGLSEPPSYFLMDSMINRKGYRNIDVVLKENVKPLNFRDFNLLKAEINTVIIDSRPGSVFANGFIPGSINIGLDGSFSIVAGSIINPASKIVVVSEPGFESETILRLTRIGYENVAGFLVGGFSTWLETNEKIGAVPNIAADIFADQFRYNTSVLIDVRNLVEWVPGFVAGAKLISLQNLEASLSEIDSDKLVFVYCANGYRSMAAASLLLKNGYRNVVNIIGGWDAFRKTKISTRQLTTTTN